MDSNDEQRLADLLRVPQPPPAAWIEAAKAAPRIAADLATVLPTIEADAEARAGETEALERSIREAGVEPRPELVAAVRRRLAAPSA